MGISSGRQFASGPLKRVMAAMLALALIAAACQAEEDVPAEDGGAAPRGGSATIASATGIPQLDPHKVVFIYETVMWGLLWDSLTRYTQDGGDEVQPGLAESWEASDDLRTWTFKLRAGVKFSDGDPVTAEDVKESVERVVDPKTGYFLQNLVAIIEEVKVVDRSTVEMRLSSPSASLPVTLTRVMIVDPDALDQVDENPVGSGPYVVEEFVPDDHVTLVPNEAYWGDRPALDEIRIVRAEDPAATVTSIRAGDFDVVYEPPWQDVQSLHDSPDIDVITVEEEPPTALHIMMDNTSPPFDNPVARQAVAYAVNRQAIVDALYAGRSEPASGNVPVPPDSPSYSGSLPSYEFDLDRAKELFEEAGITEGDTLTYWSTSAIAEFTPIGEILQNDLSKIGIELQIRNEEVGTWVAKFAPAGKKWPGLLIPNFYTGLPPPLLLSYWTGFCECNYDSNRFQDALNEAEATADEASRTELYMQAQEVFAEEAPVAVVQVFSVPIAVRSNVAGVWHDPGGYVQFHNLAPAE
jgi:peptide/nickel transport system substrate-binding protein